MPRVSVIIPAFNAAAHIAEALESVRMQSYDDWEVVVADDGSTDETRQIASSFGHSVVSTAANAGPAAARNVAIANARGELLAFLDADDYWLPSYLERQVGLFDEAGARGTRVGVVACDAHVLAGSEIQPTTYMEISRFPEELTLTRLLAHNPVFVSALVPRSALDDVGGFCEEIFGTEDYDLWIRIVEQGYALVANREPLAVYRLAGESVSADAGRMARALLITYRRALDRQRLNPRQRRIVRRNLRLQRLVEKLSALRASRRGGTRVPLGQLVRTLPLVLAVAAENPRRWFPVVRRVVQGRSPYLEHADAR
jgi:glycosyltransferase involved in cell wall biosynthesis